MAQFIGFGDGSSGTATSNASPNTYATCTGTAGQYSLTSALTVSPGDKIFIHQTQHATTYGLWEVNQVVSSSGGVITLLNALDNSYSTGAQVVKMPQYAGIILSGSNAITPSAAWAGSTGGIVALLCAGTISLNCNSLYGIVAGRLNQGGGGFGFRGGTGIPNNGGGNGRAGEGFNQTNYNGQGNTSTSDGGGGSGADGGDGGGAGGAAAANGTNGNPGNAIGGTAYLNDADLSSQATFGAGGGSGAAKAQSNSGDGGQGAGLIYIAARNLVITSSVSNIMADGAAPGNSGQGSGGGSGGNGGGGGGSIIIKARSVSVGTSLITALGADGSNGTGSGNSHPGGAGGNGRIRIETCSLTGTTNPASSSQTGGFSYCSEVAGMI